jgi:hypothetical protein
MKRWGIRILMLLLLGAIVNVAVAAVLLRFTSLALFAERISNHSDLVMLRLVGWTAPVLPNYGVVTEVYLGTNVIWRVHRHQRGVATPLEYLGADVSAGWPLHSFTGVTFDQSAFAGGPTIGQPRRFWMLEVGGGYWRFPFRPIWPGFAINTAFHAAVLWMLFAAPFALRRWRRIRRGLCPKCGDDLRGTESAICPECGTHLL